MIIDKKHVFKTFRDKLRLEYTFPSLVFSLKSGLFDFFVSSVKEDLFYTMVFEYENKSIDGLKNAIKRHSSLSSKILTKRFYIVLVTNNLQFKYIEVK